MTSDPYLRRWYLHFNEKFFEGALPEETELWWQPCGANMALTFELHPAVDGNPAILAITFDPSLMGLKKITRLVLCHEMCHVKLWARGYKLKDHGRRFDEEIQRLTGFRDYRKLL